VPNTEFVERTPHLRFCPIGLGFVVSVRAAITPLDIIFERSAARGLLAIHAELAGAPKPKH
jgi:hypothetical protein